jgi:HK97 family phage prohead protease
MMKRAYSLLEIKAMDDDTRELTGIATTPETDRMGDIVEPKGAEFKLPLPFLWQHDSGQPIGHVTSAKVTKDGIEIKATILKTDEPGKLKDRLDEAWQSIKLGLVRGLSIGFQSKEAARIEGTFGMRFMKWLWLELSAVTIPANAEASIVSIKSIDTQQRAASGQTSRRVVTLIPSPGVSGTPAEKPAKAAKRGPVKLIPR